MDEIRIWNKERNPSEILRDYSCRLTGSESNLVSYWDFDSCSAIYVTGHVHNGTLMGNAIVVPISGEDVIHAGCLPYLSIRVSQVELCWDSTLTNTYQLQYSSLLTSNQWVNLGAPTAGDGSRQCTNDFVPQNQPQRFYRLTVIP